MPVVLLAAAAAAIVAGAVLAARGRAAVMAMFLPDAAMLPDGEITPPEVALLRLPLSLWGYNAAATDETLRAIARALAARDTEIAALRQALARAGPDGQPDQTGQAGQPGSAAWLPERGTGD